MPRPPLPVDDLYARLELPTNATREAIEIAWRALLRRHHPDVAGPAGLEHAKRINVAHDWLSDPDLRARYDHERGIRGGRVRPSGVPWRERAGEPPARPVTVRRRQRAELRSAFLDRVGALTIDDLDRMALVDPAPIAFGATIRRFLPEDLRASLEAAEAEVDRRLPSAAAPRRGIRDTIHAYAAEIVLGPFLDELLSEPFRERTRERLSRGWEASVDQPRYGPNGDAVRTLIGRLQGLDDAGVATMARTGARTRLGDDPWPPGTSPDDDEGLRVSSTLAARDAAAAVPAGSLDPAVVARARRAAQRIAHLLVLRHAFAPAVFDGLIAPWRPGVVPEDPVPPRVRRPSSA
jgi:curved DNA-binding protein CbpA